MESYNIVTNMSANITSCTKEALKEYSNQLNNANKMIVRICDVNHIGIDCYHKKISNWFFTLDEHPDHIVDNMYVLEFIIVTNNKIHNVTLYQCIQESNTIDRAVINLLRWHKHQLSNDGSTTSSKVFVVIPIPTYCKLNTSCDYFNW